jgi:catechol 2,3-dioxygenase-like lactoylglutathione lyase family enzyme
MTDKFTIGVHHIGLAVPDLEAAQRFFCEVLDWDVVGGIPAYPSAFVSDGHIVLTLWRLADPQSAVAFDRRSNVGLHHLALAVPDETALMTVYDRVRDHPGVTVEFSPEPSRPGSLTRHFVCAMPGSIRLEFATSAASSAPIPADERHERSRGTPSRQDEPAIFPLSADRTAG